MRAFVLLTLLLASPALAQSTQNASAASGATSVAVGAIGESGLRAAAGVVAVPIGGFAVTAGSAGVAASASGQAGLAAGFSGAAGGLSEAADASGAFSNAPLTITENVVIAQPQPAPNVPFAPAPPALAPKPKAP